MNYLPKLTDAPFAADGGIREPVPASNDPYRKLDELMVVLEALCPVWPQRPVFDDKGQFLL
jgi:hypothetical protein